MSGSIKSYPGASPKDTGQKLPDESMSVVFATGTGGGGGPITSPLGPNLAAASVSITFATDEVPHHVIVDSSALPTGAATSAAQGTGNASLASIDTKTPALGQALAAASTPVVLTAAQIVTLTPPTTVTVTQATGTNLHTTVDNFPATQPVSGTVTANAGTGTFAVSAVSLPLPTGAATESTLAKLPVAQGSTTSTQSGPLVQGAVTTAPPTYTTAQTSPLSLTTAGAVRVDASASTQPISGTVAATQSGTWNITNVSGTVSLPTGASTSALQTTGNTTLSTISGQLPSTLGIKTSAASLSITPASDAVFALAGASNPKTGRSIVVSTYKDYTAGSVTTAAYTQLIASTAATINLVEVFDSSGEAIILAVGAAASEVDQFYIFPGGNGPVSLAIPTASRVSIKAKTNTASVGYQLINFYS